MRACYAMTCDDLEVDFGEGWSLGASALDVVEDSTLLATSPLTPSTSQTPPPSSKPLHLRFLRSLPYPFPTSFLPCLPREAEELTRQSASLPPSPRAHTFISLALTSSLSCSLRFSLTTFSPSGKVSSFRKASTVLHRP